MLIEYKGEHLEAKASEQTKRDIGRQWEQRSGGKVLFLWALKLDSEGSSVAQQVSACVARVDVNL